MALTIGPIHLGNGYALRPLRSGRSFARRRRVLLALPGAVLGGVAAIAQAQGLPGQATSTVVIWNFEDHTAAAATSVRHVEFLLRTLPDAVLETLLAEPGLVVVDRLRLQDILAEQKLGSSELSDEAARLRLGRIVGANYMVFGGFMVVGEQVQVDLRVVASATTEVVFADQFTAAFDGILAETQRIAGAAALALGGHPRAPADVLPDAVWPEYERALALSDAGRVQEAIEALTDLLNRHGDFAAAERQLVNLYAKLARR